MTDSYDADDSYGTSGQPTEMTLSKEVLHLGTEWTVSGGIRMRRRIVTETRTVQVTLRREELEFEVEHIEHEQDGTLLGSNYAGPVTGPPQPKAPLVIVLQQEEPDIGVRLVPYEKITVTTTLVRGAQQVQAGLRHEVPDLQVTSSNLRYGDRA